MDDITISIDNIELDKMTFTYDALQFLITDENEILSILQDNIENIMLVPFKINFDGINPFNSFMLLNNFALDKLCFPYLDINTLNIKLINDYSFFISIIKCYLFSLNLLTDYEDFDKNFDFKGVHIYNNRLYLFIDLTKTTIESNLMYRNVPCWFALIDEIVNKKHVCNIKIDDEVTNFFLYNNIFLHFKNLQKEQIEIPTVVYSGIHEKLLYFNFLFGKTKDDSNSILGANYYFTNYTNAIRQGSWSKNYKREFRHGVEITENENGKYIKGGIVRYAIFLGNCLIKENMPNDKIDESELKIERLENSDDYNYEKMTLRISDHDAVWKLNYDSVILGNIELDDGQQLKDAPMYVVKDFENHLPLSYHFINKINLKDIYYKSEEYHIL
jgi:hypothetical protein